MEGCNGSSMNQRGVPRFSKQGPQVDLRGIPKALPPVPGPQANAPQQPMPQQMQQPQQQMQQQPQAMPQPPGQQIGPMGLPPGTPSGPPAGVPGFGGMRNV